MITFSVSVHFNCGDGDGDGDGVCAKNQWYAAC